MTKRLTLLRHGETGYSGRYVGALDVPLSPEGRQQIAALGKHFNDVSSGTVIISPMLRCRQSANILFSSACHEVDDDLREIDFGRWEGKTFQEIVATDSALVERWADWSFDFSFPEGENVGNFIHRVNKAGERLLSAARNDAVVVAHGGVIRTLLCYFLKLDPSCYLLFKVKKGTFCTLELFSDGAVLTGLNLGT